jgi:hypothetical protein
MGPLKRKTAKRPADSASRQTKLKRSAAEELQNDFEALAHEQIRDLTIEQARTVKKQFDAIHQEVRASRGQRRET